MQVAVDTMHQQQIAEFALLKRRQKRLEEMIRGMIVAPARRAGPLIVVGNGGIRTGDPTPTDPRCPKLMSCPRSLGVLWEEWQNGIAGSKPARLYNARERGRNKSRYCRRLVFWKCMKRLCDRGCTVNSAIDRIQRVYGDIGVSRMLVKMTPDERRGGHANLRT